MKHPKIDNFKCERVEDGCLTDVTLEPSWSWRHHVKPFLDNPSDLCTLQHRVKIISGELEIRYLDGIVIFTKDDGPFLIDEPHEARVIGEKKCVFTHLELIDLNNLQRPLFRKSHSKSRSKSHFTHRSSIQKKLKLR